jgi:hypothetical protein
MESLLANLQLHLAVALSHASMRKLAHCLLAVEAANGCTTDEHVHEAVRVCEQLRISLIRLAGSDAFASLLRRTLALSCNVCGPQTDVVFETAWWFTPDLFWGWLQFR